MPNKVIFFGTSVFALPVLEKLARSEFRPLLVVTTPDAPVGRKQVLRPSSVKRKALELDLEVFDPKTLKSDEVIERIKRLEPEVGVLAAYGKIIPQALLGIFPKGILNIHPSLLPRWRGPTPIQSTILAGDDKTGVAIILIDEEVDHGPVLAKSEIRISKSETYKTLHLKLAQSGADLLMETLPKWLSGDITPLPQDYSQATLCKKFTREDAKIDWQKSAEEIDRQVRALNPEPGTWTEWSIVPQSLKATGIPAEGLGTNAKSQILKILQVQPFSNSRELENKKAGEVFVYEGKPAVRCGDNALILETVQPEGKKPMTGADFLRGHREIVGQILS